jgi:hypothetical protein
MNATPERAAPAYSDAAATAPEDSVAPLATAAADVIGAWASLLNLELVLAQRSLRWLLIGAIAVPVAGLSVWLSFSVLLVTVAHVYTNSWLLALVLGSGVQLLALAILLSQLQRWARDLTLPQSRAALVHAMKRMS